MDSNDIITAPALPDVATLYPAWKDIRGGTLDDFYQFMTVPSRAREEFIDSRSCKLSVRAGTATISVR